MNKTIWAHFKSVDPRLFAILEKIELDELKKSQDFFASLCREIIGQQLSGKAADAILKRVQETLPGKKFTPEAVLAVSKERLRAAGPSWAKVDFLKNLANKVMSNELNLDLLDNLDDMEVIKQLTQVKGIGPWTAEMFLMFSLGREDVFSHGDLGLRKAIKRLYRFKKEPTRVQIDKIARKWSPYRTYACCLLWRSLDLPDA